MLDALDNNEKDVVRRSMVAASDGPFFPDWEFQTLFGIERADVRAAVAAFPNLAAANERHFLAANNSMFMLTTYPLDHRERLADYQLDLLEVARVHSKLRGSLGKPTKTFLDHME